MTAYSPLEEESFDFYPKDVYMAYRGHSLGWWSWIDRWKQVDWQIKDYLFFKYNFIARAKFNRGGNGMADMLDRQMKGELVCMQERKS